MSDGPLAQKIGALLGIAYADSSLKHELNVLDEILAGSDPNERLVRTRVEKDYLSKIQIVLDRLEPFYEAIQSTSSSIDRTEVVQNKMKALVSDLDTRAFISDAQVLETEIQNLESKSHTLEAWNKSFALSSEDIQALETHSVDSPTFSNALSRAREINNEAAVVLAESPEAGEKMMGYLSKTLDSAYSRLQTAIDQRMTSVGVVDGSAGLGALRKYIAIIAEDRPLVFKQLLSGVSATRRTALANQFTRLETDPSEPFRSLGDILAWIHSAIVQEFEYLSLLVADPDWDPQQTRMAASLLNSTDTQDIISDMVNQVTQILNSPLRLRITQITVNQQDPVVLDQCEVILRFYHGMLTKYDQHVLIDAFKDAEDAISRQFVRSVNIMLEKYSLHFSRELKPSPRLEAAVSLLADILRAHEHGLSSELNSRVQFLLYAPLQQAREAAQRLPEDERELAVLNCLDIVRTRLVPFIETGGGPVARECERIEEEIAARSDTQGAVESRKLCEDSGILEGITDNDFSMKFDLFLSSASFDLAHRLRYVDSPTIASNITRAAVTRFVEAYAPLVERGAPRKVEDVRTLLL